MASRCYRAVLFDFDGTLADSYPAIAASVNFIRAKHHLPPLSEDEVRKQVGRGAAYLMEHTVPGTDLENDLALYRRHHPTVMVEGTRLMPGVVEMLTALKEQGRWTGLCSNKPIFFTRGLLDHFGLTGLLDAVLGPEMVARPKPAPDMLLAALHQLQVDAAEALYVGDMSVDIQTARAAGTAVWVVPTGSEDRPALLAARPDRLIERLSDLPGLLAGEG